MSEERVTVTTLEVGWLKKITLLGILYSHLDTTKMRESQWRDCPVTTSIGNYLDC